MSLVYETLKPVINQAVKGMLLGGMRDPDAFMVQLREMQKKGLPLDKLHKSVDFIEEEQYYKVLSHNCRGHHMILYFFGGGFCKPMTSRDFKYAQDMADHTGSDVWIVKYALFPDATGYDIAESAVNAYRVALKEYSSEEISFYGNSSGAALCFETLLFI